MTEHGGPAFPNTHQEDRDHNVIQWTESGMTLRDYFAATTLGGFCASSEVLESFVRTGKGDPLSSMAQRAYEMADAMLKARQA